MRRIHYRRPPLLRADGPLGFAFAPNFYRLFTSTCLSASVALACTATASAPPAGQGGGDQPLAPNGVDPVGAAPNANAPFGAGPASLKRLRAVEYQNSVRDLLGPRISVSTELESDLARGGFTTISAAIDPYSSTGIEHFETAAYDLARQIFQSPAIAQSLVGCQPSAVNDPCIATFLSSFGRRVFRRPLAASEAAAWAKVVSDVADAFHGDVSKGLEHALAGLLQSPNFLYRADVGEPVPDAGERRRYTAYEMASRLSFALWETTPDAALLDAAESGSLATADGVAVQAQRLLADPRSGPSMLRFFRELLRLGDLATEFHPKNAALFPSASDALYRSMQTEIELGVSAVLNAHGNALDLLTSQSTYVDGPLAALYGVPAPSGAGFERVALPPGRVGYLTSGAFLSINSHAEITSPTRRGVYVLQSLLCRSVPPPPPTVNTALAPAVGAVTTRQRLASHRENPACATCHALFDPVGLTFEHFDALGGYREKESGLAIDTSGQLDGTAFTSPLELAKLLHDSPEAARCFVANAYRYTTGHNIVAEAAGEAAVVDALTASFSAAGNDYMKLMADTVQNAAFRAAVGQY